MDKKKSSKIINFAVPIGVFAAIFCLNAYYTLFTRDLQENVALSGGDDIENLGRSALQIFESSLDLKDGLACKPSHDDAGWHLFVAGDYLEIGSFADVYFGADDKAGKPEKYELMIRAERDSLQGADRSKWGVGVITREYLKSDSCYWGTALIEVDGADSVVITDFDRVSRDDTLQYVGKRQNGIVTECSVCKFKDGVCNDTISVEQLELNPESGKIAKHTYKTRKFYLRSDLPETENQITFTSLFDSLGRLVNVDLDEVRFRYEYSTNDTANFDLYMYDDAGRKIGFYKKTTEENGNIVKTQYKVKDSYMTTANYYENGKVKKVISTGSELLGSTDFRIKMFNDDGDEILDSAFTENLYLPGDEFVASSYVVRTTYGANRKIKKLEDKVDYFNRFMPIYKIFPLKSLGEKKIGNYKLEYDGDRLAHVTYESENLELALSRGLPGRGQRIVYSKGKLENIQECEEPRNTYTYSRSYETESPDLSKNPQE